MRAALFSLLLVLLQEIPDSLFHHFIQPAVFIHPQVRQLAHERLVESQSITLLSFGFVPCHERTI